MDPLNNKNSTGSDTSTNNKVVSNPMTEINNILQNKVPEGIQIDDGIKILRDESDMSDISKKENPNISIPKAPNIPKPDITNTPKTNTTDTPKADPAESQISSTEKVIPKISPIRTYKDDVANALKHGNASVISIAVSEQNAKLKKEQPAQKTTQDFSKFGIPKAANVSVDPSMYAGAPTVEPSQTEPGKFVKKEETAVTMPKEGIRVMPKASSAELPKVHTYINNTNPTLNNLNNAGTKEVKIKTTSPWKNILFVILGIALISGGGYGLYYIYKIKKPPVSSTKVTNLENITSIIPTNNHIKIVISTSTKPIVSTLSKAVSDASGNDGSITDVFFRYSNDIRDGGSDITAKDFIKLADLKIPDSLFRVLKDPFMFGYHKISGIDFPFIILKVDFFQGALSSMLRYESSIIDDFWPFIVKEGGADTKTNISFGDKIIKNKDARILKNVFSGKTLLLYSFIDSETLVITTSEDSFIYLIDEISRQKFVR